MIDLSKIRKDGGTQSRASINEDTVAEYAEAMENPETVFPPIVVYYDGKDYWLADGFHRVAAWERAGRIEVPATIHQGDRRRAILHSVAANACHGLRRTNDDKRRAVMTLLEDDEWSNWSANKIAKQCGVSHTFVNGLKSSLETNSSEPRTYTTKHGTEATMDTSRIGKPEAPEEGLQPAALQETQPEASVRQPEQTEERPVEAECQPEAQDPHRKGLSGLTREGLEDEVAGLRADVADMRAQVSDLKGERDDLSARLKDATSSDQGAAISRLHKRATSLTRARDEALAKAAKETRRANFIAKERDELRSQIETREITI